jgi:hypothetical protein
MSTTTFAPLKWVTVINGLRKQSTTHFGTIYVVEKHADGQWKASVRRLPFGNGGRESTHVLAAGVTFAQARKSAIVDYTENGGR